MDTDKKVYLYYIAVIVVILLGIYLFFTQHVIPKDVIQIGGVWIQVLCEI